MYPPVRNRYPSVT